MEDLCLSRTKKMIYFFIWRRLGKVARTGNAAAAAALGRVMLVDGDGGNDDRNIQDIPLLADILGLICLTRVALIEFFFSFYECFSRILATREARETPQEQSAGNCSTQAAGNVTHVVWLELNA